jgi:predicted DNA-binding transcriptional regulator AlpA
MNTISNEVTLPHLLTQIDLAEYLSKSTAWCERARWAGDGPKFIKLGRHVRYKASDVFDWIESNSKESTSDGAEQ